jgi:hypothetical protein
MVKSNRQPSKFTPDTVQQIRNLIELGKSVEEIAARIGVTVGTLQVSCSRLGISLRRPRPRNGVPLLPGRGGPAQPQVTRHNPLERAQGAKFTISEQYNGEERTTELALRAGMVSQLALEASSQGLRITEFACDLILSVIRKGLFEEVLGPERHGRRT